MSDLIERLRTGMGGFGTNAIMQEAADEIARLKAVLTAIRDETFDVENDPGAINLASAALEGKEK